MTDSTGQITALMHNYCELFDTGRFDEFAAQFALPGPVHAVGRVLAVDAA